MRRIILFLQLLLGVEMIYAQTETEILNYSRLSYAGSARAAARNKKLVENYFARERAGIGQRRKNAKSAFDYYKSMSGAGYVPPQMYDNKQ